MNDLAFLASLIRDWNITSSRISEVIGRPSNPGHIAEYIASIIFDIRLMESAAHKSIDGHFSSGSLAGSSVNIKWTGKHEGLLNMSKGEHPDYYVVLAGPKAPAETSKGKTRPWVVDYVFLFNSKHLVKRLEGQGVSIGTASSLRNSDWYEAEIFPVSRNKEYQLSASQIRMISLFSSKVASA